MAHDYGVPLRFLAVTITRDNEAAPGNRLVDKHTRLFHGKTLDEWCMIQVWSSKYAGKHIFVCETENHAEKLRPLAEKYGVIIYVRPRDMLHPLNDSGLVPLAWATRKALSQDFHTLITHPMVVNPCRPPGFIDRFVEIYQEKISTFDWYRTDMRVIGAYAGDFACFELNDAGIITQPGTPYINNNERSRFSSTSHWIASSVWWDSFYHLVAGRSNLNISGVVADIEPWEDIHIDTQEQWEWAEYWFAKKILSQGENCYERYRESWA
jgi:hypothetical protein